jgi:hypothetical protein
MSADIWVSDDAEPVFITDQSGYVGASGDTEPIF